MNRNKESSAAPRPIVYYPERLEHTAPPQQLTPSQAVRLSEDPDLHEMAQRTGQARLRLPDEAPREAVTSPAPAPRTAAVTPPIPGGAAAAGAALKRLPFDPPPPKPSLLRRLLSFLGR
ncbi:MAG: hypothetical protein ACR2MA_02490 [Egibacteraceae bacterium]